VDIGIISSAYLVLYIRERGVPGVWMPRNIGTAQIANRRRIKQQALNEFYLLQIHLLQLQKVFARK